MRYKSIFLVFLFGSFVFYIKLAQSIVVDNSRQVLTVAADRKCRPDRNRSAAGMIPSNCYTENCYKANSGIITLNKKPYKACRYFVYCSANGAPELDLEARCLTASNTECPSLSACQKAEYDNSDLTDLLAAQVQFETQLADAQGDPSAYPPPFDKKKTQMAETPNFDDFGKVGKASL